MGLSRLVAQIVFPLMFIDVVERTNGTAKVIEVVDDKRIVIAEKFYKVPTIGNGKWDDRIQYDCFGLEKPIGTAVPIEIYEEIIYYIVWTYLMNREFDRAWKLVSHRRRLVSRLCKEIYGSIITNMCEKIRRVGGSLRLIDVIEEEYFSAPHRFIFPNTVIEFCSRSSIVVRPWLLDFDRLVEVADEFDDDNHFVTVGKTWRDICLLVDVETKGYYSHSDSSLETISYECDDICYPFVQMYVNDGFMHYGKRISFDKFEDFMKIIYGKYATLIVN